MLRAGIGEEAEPGGGTLMDYRDMSWSLELEFHVDVFLLRKSDGKILSLCAGTSRCDSKQDETDSLARRMHDINPDKKSTEYCWLIPGTGTDDGHGVSVVPARLVLKSINFGPDWNGKDPALAKLPSTVPEFESEEAKADWESQHRYWEAAVASVSVSLREDEEFEDPYDYASLEKRCEFVSPLLGLLETPVFRHRWV